ncbi:MFS transporter [Campylobacter helveticus]|uniref:MFS transporter n=1 Tax=Campylobacter helveticus TaxID=28898 RepID=UPI0010472628|nr:MFS transporter [Campylobacter helveticus]QBL12260.1 MFS transporter [Campylobacter helveticus]
MQTAQNKLERKIATLTERLGFKLAIFSAAMMTFLGPVLVSPALPQIAKEFASTPHIELLTGLSLTIPALAMIFFTPLAGILMDKYVKLKLLYPMMLIWTLAGVSGAWCDSIYTLLLSRFVLGISGAFITTGASALIGDYFSIERRDRALSLQGFVMALGSAVLTVLVGYLVSLSWHYAFYVYGSGILIFIFCLFYLFEPRKKKKKLNFKVKPQYKNYANAYFIGFFSVFMYYLVGVHFPHYIEDILGLEAKYIGFAMALVTLAYAFSAYFYKDLKKLLSIKQIFVLAVILEAFGFLLVALVQDFRMALISLFIFGVSGGLIITNNNAYLFTKTTQEVRARAYGGLASAMFLGQFLSPILTTPLLLALGFAWQFALWTLLLLVVAFYYHKRGLS